MSASRSRSQDDSLFPTHRDLSAQLTKGLDLIPSWRNSGGGSTATRAAGTATATSGTGRATGPGPSCHTFRSPPRGVRRGARVPAPERVAVAMAICGDGATSNGRWHEALNVSAVHRLSVVWVVNNNQYAYSTPNPLEFPVPTIAERGGLRHAGAPVDAQDVLEVYNGATRPSSEHAMVVGHLHRVPVAALARSRGPRPGQVRPKELLEDYMTRKTR